jgi:DNA primase
VAPAKDGKEAEREDVSQLRALVLAGAAALRTAPQWEALLRRAERHADSGFVNTMLIWVQCPDAIELRDYREWQLAGRQVMRGEQAVLVIQGERVRRLFDLMQTEGEPLPIRFPRPRTDRAVRPDAWRELAVLALHEGVFVPGAADHDTTGAADWLDWTLRVRGDEVAMGAAVDLTRRVARHLVHGSGSPFGELGQAVAVESVAFLLALRLGLDVSGFSFPAVTSWAGADERAQPGTWVTAMGEQVIATAQRAFVCLGTDHASVPRPVTGPRLARKDRPTLVEQGSKPVPVAQRGEPVPVPRDGEAAQIQQAAARFFARQRNGGWVPGYLAARGFSEAVQQRWHIGYAPQSWPVLVDHLRGLGFGDDAIEASGLAKRSARGTLYSVFRDRAMFPVRSADGAVVGFTGRARGDVAPKYLNGRQTDLYRKGEVLFGLAEGRRALAGGARPVIVEGPLDAIAVTEAGDGRYVGVAPCGTALTSSHAYLLLGHTDTVIVAFDADQAGHRAAVRAWKVLADKAAASFVVALPTGHDPASLLREQGSGALAAVLDEDQRPLADVAIDATLAEHERWLQFTEGKFNALHAVAPLLAGLPVGQVARQVGRVAEHLGLTHAEVTTAVTDAIAIAPESASPEPEVPVRAARADSRGRATGSRKPVRRAG